MKSARVTLNLKICRRCFLEKRGFEFKKDLRNGDNYSSFCKQCHKEASIKWQKENPEKVNKARKLRYDKNKDTINTKRRESYNYEKSRWQQLKRLYKIDKEWYSKKIEEQNFGCAICKRKKEEFKGKFVIDHDHSCCDKTPTCGRCTRGILCHYCNISLYSVETISNWTNLAEGYLNENSKNTKGN